MTYQGPNGGSGFHGWVTTGGVFTVAEQAQMLAAQKKTGELRVTNGHCSGTLYFRDGQIVDAVCGTSHKRGFHGAACVLCMCGNPASEFRPTGPPEGPPTVHIPTMAVLLEAARRMDEGERPCAMMGGNGSHPHHPQEEVAGPDKFLRVILASREEFLPIKEGVARVWRDTDCEVFVSHLSVSRRHADLHRIGPILILRDVGSRNGTYVNGNRIQQARVDAGDEIRFAEVRAFLVGPEATESHRRTEPVLASRPPPENPAQTMCIRLPEPAPAPPGNWAARMRGK